MTATTHPSPSAAVGSTLTPTAARLTGYWIASLIFLGDQGLKYLVHESTPYGWLQPVTSFFNLVHVWNYGAAFSFLADAGGWQRYFFGAVALIVSLGLIWMLRKPLPLLERLGVGLLLGGALGNGLDRAWRGYVVDFLDVHLAGWHWPAFNLADIGIVCGAALMVVASFRRPPSQAGA